MTDDAREEFATEEGVPILDDGPGVCCTAPGCAFRCPEGGICEPGRARCG